MFIYIWMNDWKNWTTHWEVLRSGSKVPNFCPYFWQLESTEKTVIVIIFLQQTRQELNIHAISICGEDVSIKPRPPEAVNERDKTQRSLPDKEAFLVSSKRCVKVVFSLWFHHETKNVPVEGAMMSLTRNSLLTRSALRLPWWRALRTPSDGRDVPHRWRQKNEIGNDIIFAFVFGFQILKWRCGDLSLKFVSVNIEIVEWGCAYLKSKNRYTDGKSDPSEECHCRYPNVFIKNWVADICNKYLV